MQTRRGVALVTTLWLIVMLGAVAMQVTSSSSAVSNAADNVRNRAIARYAAESGVVLTTARIEESLATLPDSAAIKSYLNGVEQGSVGAAEATLGDGRIQISIVDVNSRLDVNAATAEQLMSLFSSVADLDASQRAAVAIRNRIDYGRDLEGLAAQRANMAKPPFATPLRSLSELRHIPGVNPELATAAAPFLTVDGDGRVNRVTASERVKAAAGGDLRDMPSRLLIISRGWKDRTALTFEIQALYAIEYGKLVLVTWRERDL